MPGITVEAYVKGFLTPLSFKDVFEWPPDLFATTSALLRITGAYRHVVSPPRDREWPPILEGRWANDTWTEAAEGLAEEWLTTIASEAPLDLPDWIHFLKSEVERTCQAWTIDSLRDIESQPDAWPLCQAILALHCIADSACIGFGTPSAPRRNPLIHFLADHLLSTYGSLSRLPKARGIVLPKMRTPQSGLTLRATSLYATWHETEVEAVWRTTPWVNAEENTLNVLILPWPKEVSSRWFTRGSHPTGLRNLGPNRYFSYASKKKLEVDGVVALLEASAKLASRIHLLVLPELAVCHADLQALQDALAERLPPDRIPLIVCGTGSWRDESQAPQAGNEPARNAVVLSMYFADKWYEMRQDKHHRWKLDRRQVQQYTIGGVLASDRSWWENVYIPRRQLSILAPTGWLAFCPLICEDLAQLEPVSDLIRGIGPTLLVALLLDSPQIPSRWSARYASVMADDPGTSVLTVTSFGMASRSKPFDRDNSDPTDDGVTVALWRDASSGFRELRLKPEDDALIVTLSADWRRELTADGRDDGGAAATFILNGVQPVRTPAVTVSEAETTHRRVMRGDPGDLYELTTFTQLVDAALDSPKEVVAKIVTVARGGLPDASAMTSAELATVVDAIRPAAEHIHANRPAKRDFTEALAYFEQLHSPMDEPNGDSRIPGRHCSGVADLRRWKALADVVDNEIAQFPTVEAMAQWPGGLPKSWRTKLVVLHSMLWAVHNRLEHLRRSGALTLDGAKLDERIERTLSRKWTFDPNSVDTV